MHDPKRVIETLRNHLTQPETNVSFLFGAGTSSSVRVPIPNQGEQEVTFRSLIPNVAELTAFCSTEIRRLDPEGVSKFATALDSIEGEVRIPGRNPNIEDVLSCVRRKISAMGSTDTLSGLTLEELQVLESTIRKTIAAQVNPDRSGFPENLPHEDFVRWIARMPRRHPVEIFTTNYDVLLETALEAERVPTFDGFVGCNRPFFLNDSMVRPDATPGAAWVRLWKVHGSINWRIDTVRGKKRVIRGEPNNDGEMIMPSQHKYDESRKQPYTALLDRMIRALARDDSILFVCGYSFSDDHVNAIIFDALEAKKRPHVIALQYVDPSDGDILSERAARFSNLLVLGPTVGIIGGERAGWKISDVSSADIYSKAFTINKKESDEEMILGTGKFLLGDFVSFSQFLVSLTGPA